MDYKHITLQSSFCRRKFLLSGISASLLILIFPVLKLFGQAVHSRIFCSREPDKFLEIVQKYGAEFQWIE